MSVWICARQLTEAKIIETSEPHPRKDININIKVRHTLHEFMHIGAFRITLNYHSTEPNIPKLRRCQILLTISAEVCSNYNEKKKKEVRICQIINPFGNQALIGQVWMRWVVDFL